MKILAYTENYASETLTFIVNELKCVQEKHDLLLVYSVRKNAERNSLNNMVKIPYKYNIFTNKINWLLEKNRIFFWLYNYNFKKELNKQIEQFKPDIIHCHFGTDFLKVAANLSKQNKSIPILISFYGYDVTERIKNCAVVKQYHKYTQWRHVFSTAVSQSLVNNINSIIKPYNKAQLLHSGIDTNFFLRKNYPLNERDFIFLQVAHFNPKKGHRYALQAFKKFIQRNKKFNYKFIIVGFGPSEQDIKNQIIELELQNFVEVRGPVTPAQMVELGSSVNCFVHMSITLNNGDQEGLPNVILEAMALELPIMATNHAGIPEIVAHNVNGILCDERNVDQYVDAFDKITGWKICPKNREKIIELFGIEKHMERINDYYKSIGN